MRVLITGSRDWRDIDTIAQALRDLPEGATIVQGCATGADAIARSLALAIGHQVEDHWPDYASFNFADANLRRNQEMVDLGADLVFAFPTASSRGTWHTINAARKAGLDVRVFAEGSAKPADSKQEV